MYSLPSYFASLGPVGLFMTLQNSIILPASYFANYISSWFQCFHFRWCLLLLPCVCVLKARHSVTPSDRHYVTDVSLFLKLSWSLFFAIISVFLPYSQDSKISCSLQSYLHQPKYLDICNSTYILVVSKHFRLRTSFPQKQSLFLSISFCDLHEPIFLVMFLTILSAKYAVFFAC